MKMKMVFDFCDSCVDKVFDNIEDGFVFNEVSKSSATFPYCSGCESYTKTDTCIELSVELTQSDECDCQENHGRTQHNDGGNYHYDRYRVLTLNQ